MTDAHGNLPEGHKLRVEAVLQALLLATEDLGGVLLQQVGKLIVESLGLLQVLVEGGLDDLHVLLVEILEETVHVLEVASDVIHPELDLLGIELLDVEFTATAGKTAGLEVKGLTAGHRAQALHRAVLVTLLVYLDVLHDVGPCLDDRREDCTEVKNHLGSSVLEGDAQLVHELDALFLGGSQVSVTEVLEVVNELLDFFVVDLYLVG